jgi:dTDP-4-dehydrorhamnose reductase
MKRSLILGKGFIGSNLSSYFSENNIDHEVYSRSMFDYTDKDKLKKFLELNKDKFFCVINTSGYTGSPNVDACESNKEECWKYNVINPLNIAKVANEFDLPVIHINSGCIYDGYDKVYSEEDTPNFGLFSDKSSFYSKTKHASEILLENNDAFVYILRIRIPFTYKNVSKNYLSKLLKYDNLINMSNSVTSVTDLNDFIFRFIYLLKDIPGGVYNVCNSEPVSASQVVDLLKSNGIENPRWNFINVDQLGTVANRSNCVLSTSKIESYNLPMPNSLESLERDIKIFKNFVK